MYIYIYIHIYIYRLRINLSRFSHITRVTIIPSLQICKTTQYCHSCRPSTLSQPPPRNIIAMISYYYTISNPKEVRLSRNIVSVWKICVHYYQHTASRKNKLMQADLIDKKFRTPNLPNLYDTERDVLVKGAKFHELF